MVSTRRSMAPDEPMEALVMSQSTKRTINSPSPKKRKFEVETPEQSFVDARATPFTQRKRALSNKSLSTPVPVMAKSSLSAENEAVSDDISDSDDEAPEAITNASTARAAKDVEAARQEETRKNAEEAREKRRKRDEVLKAQKQTSKAANVVSAQAPTTEHADELGDAEAEVLDRSAKSTRPVLPRMLPDEILNQPQESSSTVNSGAALSQRPTHIKFEPKREVQMMKKGPLTVQLLKKQRRDMAPKKSASAANTRNQWLYQRGQNSVNRRPIKKALA